MGKKYRVKKSRIDLSGKKKVLYYGTADGALKQQFSDSTEDLSTCEEDCETDLTATVTGSNSSSELFASDDFSSSLLVGDVIWSRFSGHNWWPSMIAYDPNTAVYFHTYANHPNIPLKYHVQFFGKKALRGWVAKSNILKFHGLQHFMSLTCNNFTPSSQKEIWEGAVKEAEEAVLLGRKERKLAYVFNYQGEGSEERRKRCHKKGSATRIDKKVPISAVYAERRKSSRHKPPGIQKKETKLPPTFEPHNTRQSVRHSIAESSVVNTILTNSPVGLVEKELEPYKTTLFAAIKDSVDSSEPVVKNTTVLRDISWVENHPLNDSVYPNVENSSDSGIEDTETLELSIDDMDSLGLKRKRKPKIFEGFHTGDEIIDAFKSKPKVRAGSTKGNEKELTNKSEKENVIVDEVPDTSIHLMAKYPSPKKCSKPNQEIPNSDDNSVGEGSISSIESGTGYLEDFSAEMHGKRKCSNKRKYMGTTKSLITEESSRPSKKAKQSSSVTNASKQVIYTKIEDCKASEKNMFGLSSAIANEIGVDKIDNNIKNNVKEDVVLDLTVLKRDPRDQFCNICEEVTGDMISCGGSCLNLFHPNCLGLNFVPTGSFICDECTTGYHTCFVCHDEVGEVKKCSQSACGKYYHPQCLEKSSKFDYKSKNKFTCPRHVCKFCKQTKSHKHYTSKRIMRCVRCPAAYHQGFCMPAGCMILTVSHMVCDEHFQPTKKIFNTTWCITCSYGGSLVCCDTCPASFHVECSDDLTSVPDGAWQCKDCRDGKKLRYGDIVWVKFSIYRWWPGRICLPENVPIRIQGLPHTVGEFPVLFFGSHDYAWLSARRVFKYAEGDTGGTNFKTYLEKYFTKALQEAKEAFSEMKKKREEDIQAFDKKQSNKPPAYGHIKVNKPVTCVQTLLDRSEWPICQCKADDPCKTECLNKILYYECNPLQCPNKESCKNQRMQKSEYAKTKMFKCEEKGWGLKADQEIKTGDFVIEYIGELIDEATCHIRIKQYHERDIYDYYFLTIDKDNIIDAYPRGNLSRFMNHSCDPNCETQKWTVNGEVRVGLFATRDILVGEELSFNYNLDCLGNKKKECKCGSANCSGFLGVQPKTQYSVSVAEKAKKLKEKTTAKPILKKKKKKKKRIVHEDECFSCGDGGELLCCDRQSCAKAYHQDCLIMKEAPRGRWECPWHFCDVCGKLARSMCSLCPNSFCESHLEGQMIELKDDVLVCPVHDKEEMEKLKQEKVDEPNTSDSTINMKFTAKQKKTSKLQGKNINLKGVSLINILSQKSAATEDSLGLPMKEVELNTTGSPELVNVPYISSTTGNTPKKLSKIKTNVGSSKKRGKDVPKKLSKIKGNVVSGKRENKNKEVVAKKKSHKKKIENSSSKEKEIGEKRRYLKKATKKAEILKLTSGKSSEEVAHGTNKKSTGKKCREEVALNTNQKADLGILNVEESSKVTVTAGTKKTTSIDNGDQSHNKNTDVKNSTKKENKVNKDNEPRKRGRPKKVTKQLYFVQTKTL